MNNVIPIESVIDVSNPGIVWSDLGPHYKGYQISNYGHIRSMKFFKKHPLGILIKPDKKGMVRLSNSLNQVEQVNVKDLFNSAKNFIIPTFSTYTRSRNPIITSKSKIMEEKRNNTDFLHQPSGFHFKTIDQ